MDAIHTAPHQHSGQQLLNPVILTTSGYSLYLNTFSRKQGKAGVPKIILNCCLVVRFFSFMTV